MAIYSEVIPQRFYIEALTGPHDTFYYMQRRFPEEIYHQTQDTHFYKLLATFLGPTGIQRIRKNYLTARIMLEERGMELFDLDSFFGNPIAFGRLLEESYEDDPTGLIPHELWEEIKSKNAQYRNRALDYVAGVRAGNTPEGMRLVAKAGLGHDVQIVENYKYLYDIHSDDPLGFEYHGKTNLTEEMIVVPRRETSRSEAQHIRVRGVPELPDTGEFFLGFNGEGIGPISWSSDAITLQHALEATPSIQPGDVEVTGGPGPARPWIVQFQRSWGARDVPELLVISSNLKSIASPGSKIDVFINTIVGGREASSEVAPIAPRDRHHLQEALWRIKPMTVLPSLDEGLGPHSRVDWKSITATSQLVQVRRYVTGSAAVSWPPVDDDFTYDAVTVEKNRKKRRRHHKHHHKSNRHHRTRKKFTRRHTIYWIEKNIEHQAPRLFSDITHAYQGFHNVQAVRSYTEAALANVNYLSDIAATQQYRSVHVGRFNQTQRKAYHFLNLKKHDDQTLLADRILADYPEGPLLARSSETINDKVYPFIDGIYPVEYFSLPGVPGVRYKQDQFWSSLERKDGDEYIELDFGSPQGVNYIAFDISKKPLAIELDYDLLDLFPARRWEPVTRGELFHDFVPRAEKKDKNPWSHQELQFTDADGNIPITRHIRLKFSRLVDPLSPFLTKKKVPQPWSIDVKNLIVGRNITV